MEKISLEPAQEYISCETEGAGAADIFGEKFDGI